MLKYGAFVSLHAIHPFNVANGLLLLHLTEVYPCWAARSFYIFLASLIVKLSTYFIFELVKSVIYAGNKH